MNGVFDIAGITKGKTFDQWHRRNIIEEKYVGELRTDIAVALKKSGRSMLSSEIYEAIGTDLPRAKVMATLVRMKGDGEIDAFAGDSPRKTLYAIANVPTGAPAPTSQRPRKTKASPKPPKHAKPRKAGKVRTAMLLKDLAPAIAKPTDTACNVPQCLPAITADKRLVMVGGTEPLIFSTEQTKAIATLMINNFGASL